MTFDHQHRHHWHYPRTAREAFGSEFAPLRRTLTFLPCLRGGWCAILIAVLLLAACVIGAKP